MKHLAAFLLVITAQFSFAQENIKLDNKAKLQEVLNSFMRCIGTKDSVKFYSLFHSDPIVWVGVYKDKTQQKRLEKDASALNYKTSDYKTWFRSISTGTPKEEKFYNINMVEDGNIASITFDYSFWADNKKGNWGKESWGLVNINGEWKITSVIFSMENEKIFPEPERNK